MLFFFLNAYLFIYFEREREKRGHGVHAEEGQRERERENPKQAPHCQHRARGMWGLSSGQQDYDLTCPEHQELDAWGCLGGSVS